jgi:hypothetical protein
LHLPSGGEILGGCQAGIEAVHGTLGLPWAGTIIATTVTFRLLMTLPPTIWQHRLLARFELLRPTIMQWRDAIMHKTIVECRRAKMSSEAAQSKMETAVREKRLELIEAEFGKIPWVYGLTKNRDACELCDASCLFSLAQAHLLLLLLLNCWKPFQT